MRQNCFGNKFGTVLEAWFRNGSENGSNEDDSPKGTLKDIEKFIVSFLWGEYEFRKKIHWRKWTDLCFPVKEGGLGFKSLSKLAIAFDCELW